MDHRRHQRGRIARLPGPRGRLRAAGRRRRDSALTCLALALAGAVIAAGGGATPSPSPDRTAGRGDAAGALHTGGGDGAPPAGGGDSASERAWLAETDRAFARLSRQQGMRAAFLANLADDAVIFRPGPVPARPYIEARPSPAIELTWAPVYTALSASGDFGYTTGPYEVRSPAPDHALEEQGYYVTVWRRHTDGTWKVVLDQGVSTPALPASDAAALDETAAEPAGAAGSGASGAGSQSAAGAPAGARPSAEGSPSTPGSPPAAGTQVTTPAGSPTATAAERVAQSALLAADRAFAGDAGAHGARAAYMGRLAPDARLYREGALPAVGREAIGQALATGHQVASSWKPTNAAASAAGDLGFTYGDTAQMARVPGRIREAATYLRLWRRQPDGAYKIVLDLVKPLPPPR